MMKKIVISVIIICIIGLGIYFAPRNLFSQDTKPKEESKQEKLDNDIYEIVYSTDYLYTKPEDLYKQSTLAVIAEYVKDNETYVSSDVRAHTLSEFKIIKTLKGKSNKETIEVSHVGGTVPMSEYIKYQSKEQTEKQGLDKLSEAEIAKRQVKFTSKDYNLSLKKGAKYVLFLTYDSDYEQYVAASDEYSMLEYSDGKVFDIVTNKYESYDYLK